MMSLFYSLQCKSGRSIKQSTNEIVMYNEVEQANPASSPLYLKEGQKYVVCHHEGVSVSLSMLLVIMRVLCVIVCVVCYHKYVSVIVYVCYHEGMSVLLCVSTGSTR